MCMCDLCQSFNINYIRVRISQSLYVDRLGVFLDGCLNLLVVKWIYESGTDPVKLESVREQVVSSAVNILSCYNVVTCMCQVLESICDSCCTGSYC